jgi:hypothetical protein
MGNYQISLQVNEIVKTAWISKHIKQAQAIKIVFQSYKPAELR